jgi:hypothetical protein
MAVLIMVIIVMMGVAMCSRVRTSRPPSHDFFSYGGSEMDAGYFVLPYWMVRQRLNLRYRT